MKSETRANLIFLSIFLAVSIPGAVMLFKKKLDPAAPRMGMAEPVRRRLPYMVPLPTLDEEVTRVIPEKTGRWVDAVNAAHGGGDSVLMHDHRPITSDDRTVQVTGVRQTGATTTFSLIAWEGGFGTEAGRYEVTVRVDGKTYNGQVVVAERVPMPDAVHRELMYGGYISPPTAVTWLQVRFDGAITTGRGVVMRVAYRDVAGQAVATVNVFTK